MRPIMLLAALPALAIACGPTDRPESPPAGQAAPAVEPVASTALPDWRGDAAKLLASPEVRANLAATLQENGWPDGEKTLSHEERIRLIRILDAENPDRRPATLLATVGGLAGFSAQMGLREQLKAEGEPEIGLAITELGTVDGGRFYIGQHLAVIGPGTGTIHDFVGQSTQRAGGSMPNIEEIRKDALRRIGTDGFGRLSVAAEHQPGASVEALLARHWSPVRAYLVAAGVPPKLWPRELGIVAAVGIEGLGPELDPTIGARIVLEAAAAMASADPNRVPHAYAF